MRAIIKYLAITVFLFPVLNSAFAQSSQDGYKFDDSGNLSEFQLTLPDSTVIKYKHLYDEKGDRENPFVEGDYANILYPDGTVVDFSGSYFNGEFYPDKYPALYTIVDNPEHGGYKFLTINQWFKMIKKESSAPKGKDMLDNVFNLRKYSIIFPDNSMLNVSCDPDPSSTVIEGYIDVCENGDSWNGKRWDLNSINWHASKIEYVDLESEDSKMMDCFISGVRKEREYVENLTYEISRQVIEGSVVTKDNEVFTGTIGLYYLTNGSYLPKSQYLKTVYDYNKFPKRGFDNIVGISFVDGNVVNKDNQIVAIFRDYKKLDEFDIASLRAAEQGKIDKARAEAEQAAKEKNAITTKFGKKYADAFFEGKVIVGMPWELVQIGLSAHSFNDFYCALLSIDSSSGYGKSQCYSLYGDDFTHRGHIWVRNNVVEYITLY